jgi:FlaA1/EpsC-like NDP-sugar epimerase
MFSTNYENFFNMKYKSKYLKKIFSISTDKAADPSSLMGVSKLMMEHKLKKIIKKYNDISVCSARFANVSFSRGSILEYALDCIKKKISFGIPANIKRYFITHEEAVSICYHALLKKNNNSIVMPNKTVLGDQIRIKDIITKILKIYNHKFIFKKYLKKEVNKKNNYIYLTNDNIVGQKMSEKFSTSYEDHFIKKNNSFLDKLSIDNLEFINLDIYNKIKLLKNIKQFKYLISNLIPGYKFKSKQIKVSQII